MITPPRISKSKQLADAVAQIVRDNFALPVESRMSPSIDFRKIKEREIKCWPATRSSELLTRDGTHQVEYEIAIAVLERIRPDDQDGEDLLTDQLLSLVETIGDSMLAKEIETESGLATIVGFTHEPLFDADLLEAHRIFAAGIAVQIARVESP